MTKHNQKQGICAYCKYIKDDCSNIESKMMRQVKEHIGLVTIECAKFEKQIEDKKNETI